MAVKRASHRGEEEEEEGQYRGAWKPAPPPSRNNYFTLVDRLILRNCKQDAFQGPWATRTRLVTGTTASGAVGINPFSGSDLSSVWHQHMRLQQKPPVDALGKARMKRGSALEDIARELYARQQGVVVEERGVVIDEEYHWLGHSPDGYVVNPKTRKPQFLIEIKVPGKPYEQIPDSYMCQMQMGMRVHKLPFCDFIVYITTDGLEPVREAEKVVYPGRPSRVLPPEPPIHRLTVHRVLRNDAYIERMMRNLNYYIDCLDLGIEPADDWSLLLEEASEEARASYDVDAWRRLPTCETLFQFDGDVTPLYNQMAREATK